jgi:Protein of unknown function (DUF2970)
MKPSPLRAILAVMWAFFGIRKGVERDKDLAAVRPIHLVVAGLLMGALFILIITTIVRVVTS